MMLSSLETWILSAYPLKANDINQWQVLGHKGGKLYGQLPQDIILEGKKIDLCLDFTPTISRQLVQDAAQAVDRVRFYPFASGERPKQCLVWMDAYIAWRAGLGRFWYCLKRA
jgi:hypothetical protein